MEVSATIILILIVAGTIMFFVVRRRSAAQKKTGNNNDKKSSESHNKQQQQPPTKSAATRPAVNDDGGGGDGSGSGGKSPAQTSPPMKQHDNNSNRQARALPRNAAPSKLTDLKNLGIASEPIFSAQLNDEYVISNVPKTINFSGTNRLFKRLRLRAQESGGGSKVTPITMLNMEIFDNHTRGDYDTAQPHTYSTLADNRRYNALGNVNLSNNVLTIADTVVSQDLPKVTYVEIQRADKESIYTIKFNRDKKLKFPLNLRRRADDDSNPDRQYPICSIHIQSLDVMSSLVIRNS